MEEQSHTDYFQENRNNEEASTDAGKLPDIQQRRWHKARNKHPLAPESSGVLITFDATRLAARLNGEFSEQSRQNNQGLHSV